LSEIRPAGMGRAPLGRCRPSSWGRHGAQRIRPRGHSDSDVLASHYRCCPGGGRPRRHRRAFPDSDPRWKGCDSLVFSGAMPRTSRKARLPYCERGFHVSLERPKLNDYRQAIRRNWRRHLRLRWTGSRSSSRLAEQVGPVGEGRSAEAQAIVTLLKLARPCTRPPLDQLAGLHRHVRRAARRAFRRSLAFFCFSARRWSDMHRNASYPGPRDERRATRGTASSSSPLAGECPVSWAINVNNGNAMVMLASRVLAANSFRRKRLNWAYPHDLSWCLKIQRPQVKLTLLSTRGTLLASLSDKEFHPKSGSGSGPAATGSVRELSSFIHLSARHKPNSSRVGRRRAIHFAGSQRFPLKWVDVEEQERFRVLAAELLQHPVLQPR